MEAGLGGGSSNAATMLFACNEIAGYPASMNELAGWASELGSDAAFFFSSGSAYCTGRGENFQDQNFEAERVLVPGQAWIAKPFFGVSTQKAYGASRPELLEKRDPRTALDSFLKGTPLFFNDLEVSSFLFCPELRDVKTALLEAGFSTVVMTGSGSAFICLGLDIAPQIKGISFTPIRPLRRERQGWYSSLSTICV
jgi:4-diphosphocytidyl-2-C-methyl-D-erythritol kinase